MIHEVGFAYQRCIEKK